MVSITYDRQRLQLIAFKRPWTWTLLLQSMYYFLILLTTTVLLLENILLVFAVLFWFIILRIIMTTKAAGFIKKFYHMVWAKICLQYTKFIDNKYKKKRKKANIIPIVYQMGTIITNTRNQLFPFILFSFIYTLSARVHNSQSFVVHLFRALSEYTSNIDLFHL